jgi:predicted RNA-binding Zn-ribbon protein involved in translation (DUF1610 family)
MGLEDRLSALEMKSGEGVTENSGPTIFKCPRCGKTIELPQGVTDYVCTDCYTTDEFNVDLLSDSAMSFTGMRINKFIPRTANTTKNKDVSKDTFIDIKNGV